MNNNKFFYIVVGLTAAMLLVGVGGIELGGRFLLELAREVAAVTFLVQAGDDALRGGAGGSGEQAGED